MQLIHMVQKTDYSDHYQMVQKNPKPSHFPRFKLPDLTLNSSDNYEFLFLTTTAKMTVQDFLHITLCGNIH